MTTPCNFEDLDCPEPENYAAVAKQLHETALQAEERIYCLEQQLRSAVNRPTYVATTTSVMGPFPDSTDPEDVWPIFRSVDTYTINFNNTTSISVFNQQWTLGAGIWHLGCCGNLSAVGAATDNSFRNFFIYKLRNNQIVTSDRVMNTTFESANGVVFYITASTVMDIGENDRILFAFNHSNVASDIQVDTGAIVWFTKLSDADVIRVI